jgi:hypothetical protein
MVHWVRILCFVCLAWTHSSALAQDTRPRGPASVSISPRAEIHAVGVHAGGPGGVSVKITRSGPPIVLLLTAHDHVLWQLDVAPGVVLEKVVAISPYTQRLHNVPASSEAIAWNRFTPGVRIFTYYGEPGGLDEFQRHVKALFGREATSFQGAERAAQVVVDGASRDLTRHAPFVLKKCGETAIKCGEDHDRVMCGGREVVCGR